MGLGEEIGTEGPRGVSSAQRGIEYHKKIEDYLTGKLSDLPSDLDWLVDKLSFFLENYTVYPEKEIKFDVFGHMITGIPDLIVQKEGLVEIWDYKTGLQSKEHQNYWLQLNLYAYGLYRLGIQDEQNSIKLVLCYLDEKKVVEKNVSLSSVKNFVLKYFTLLNSPYFFNKSSCANCDYINICQR